MRFLLCSLLLFSFSASFAQEQGLYGCDMLNCVLRDSAINQKFVIDKRVQTPVSILDEHHFLANCQALHTKAMTIEIAETDDKYGGDKIGSQLVLVNITANDSSYTVHLYDESLQLYGVAELKKVNNKYYVRSRKFNYRED
ncbi:MAG: hypothetical protein JSS96_11865 [Bacteroidetes bacterium]|nr:hypothetical protein [Bacteroidota bacterium]